MTHLDQPLQFKAQGHQHVMVIATTAQSSRTTGCVGMSHQAMAVVRSLLFRSLDHFGMLDSFAIETSFLARPERTDGAHFFRKRFRECLAVGRRSTPIYCR